MSSAAQVLQQAEALKASVSDTSNGSNEAWISRQNLQDLYQKLLVLDLEYALDKKVEQDLWNHAFKNQINTLQTQAKDKQNPKRAEIQSSLNLFLETAGGFYLQLLQELCSAFRLDLAFRRKSSNLGILKEYGPVNSKIRTPKKSSCWYICQHCLVHLGDIARYRQQIEQAQSYYRHAAQLVPYNGQPYNQLAILEAAKGNKLSTVFYYIRSIAVKHPFPVATTNLDKFYAKISKDTLELRGKLSMSEIISSFLQFHAFIHLNTEMEKARRHEERVTLSLPTHITSLSFSSYQLIQMLAINLYAMFHARKRDTSSDTGSTEGGGGKETEDKASQMVLNLTVAMFDHLLHLTPKQEQKAKEYHTLASIKVILDWLSTDPSLLTRPVFTSATIWPNLSKLLNNLQYHPNQKDSVDLEKFERTPLPEDLDLQYFLPLHKSYANLDMSPMLVDGLAAEVETRLRCHRILQHGIWIAEHQPSLVKFQKLKSGKLQFLAASSAQAKSQPDMESESKPSEKKLFTRQKNAAIQAIMQKHATKKHAEPPSGGHGDVTPTRIQHKHPEQEQSKMDASVMAHATQEVKDLPVIRHTPVVLKRPQTAAKMAANPNAATQHVTLSSTGASQPSGPSDGSEVPPIALPLKPGQVITPGMQLTRPAPVAAASRAFQVAPGMAPHAGRMQTEIMEEAAGIVQPDVMVQSTGIPIPSYQGQYPASSPYGSPNIHTPGGSMMTRGSSPGDQTQMRSSLPPNLPETANQNIPHQTSYGQIYPGPSPNNPPRQKSPSHSPGPPTFLSQLGMQLGGLGPGSDPSTMSALQSLLNSAANSMTNPPGQNSMFSQMSMPKNVNYQQDPMFMSLGGGGNQSLGGGQSFLPQRDSTSPNFFRPSDLHSHEHPFIKKEGEGSRGGAYTEPPSRMAANFNSPSYHMSEIVAKPSSPILPPGGVGSSSLFSSPSDRGSSSSERSDIPATSTYQLFSQSPWSVHITHKSDQSTSHSSSPFGSSSSSLRNTPDPFMDSDLTAVDGMMADSGGTQGMSFTLPYGVSPTPKVESWPPPQPQQRPPPPQTQDSQPRPGANMQSLWSAGPSPLEKLLEQQKQQRLGDPH